MKNKMFNEISIQIIDISDKDLQRISSILDDLGYHLFIKHEDDKYINLSDDIRFTSVPLYTKVYTTEEFFELVDLCSRKEFDIYIKFKENKILKNFSNQIVKCELINDTIYKNNVEIMVDETIEEVWYSFNDIYLALNYDLYKYNIKVKKIGRYEYPDVLQTEKKKKEKETIITEKNTRYLVGSNRCHYLKYTIADSKGDISLRYFYEFQDRPDYTGKWYIKSHKDKQYIEVINLQALKHILKNMVEKREEIIGRKRHRKYEKHIREF